MKRPLTTCSSSSPSSSTSSSSACVLPTQSETPRPKRAKRAKKSSLTLSSSDAKSQNPTSPASTRRSSIYRGVTRLIFEFGSSDWICVLFFFKSICENCMFVGFYRHRWTGRFEAHLWDKSSWNSIQNKKGKQGFLILQKKKPISIFSQ